MVAVENVGVQIEPVGPDNSPELRIDANASEVVGVAERFAHGSPEHVSEVHDALAAVIEAETERVALKRFDVRDGNHGSNATGEGRPQRADRVLAPASSWRVARPGEDQPIRHKPQRSRWQPAIEHLERVDRDLCDLAAVSSVEMSWRMVLQYIVTTIP